jgi:hypothetical protein
VAIPFVDQGFDGYVRRVRTMHVAPYQLKARRTLSAAGTYVAYLPVRAIREDPHGYLVLAYMPPPALSLYRRLYVIPVSHFVAHCPRDQATGRSLAQYVFRGHLDGDRPDPWTPFVSDLSDVGNRWLDLLPGSPPIDRQPLAVPPAAKPALGAYGELWLAAELERLGQERFVVARERVDVDTVDLLLHELRTHRFAGVQVKTATIESGRVEFGLSQDTFFVDPSLVLIVLPCSEGGRVGSTSFILPSIDVPGLTSHTSYRGRPRYTGKIRVNQIAERFRQYAVPTERLGSAILKTLFTREIPRP